MGLFKFYVSGNNNIPTGVVGPFNPGTGEFPFVVSYYHINFIINFLLLGKFVFLLG